MSYPRHGERYLDEDEFLRYCSDLNLPLRKSTYAKQSIEPDLYRFERLGLLVPAAIVFRPEDYTQEMLSLAHSDGRQSVFDNPKWLDLKPFEDTTYIEDINMTDADLWHYFDREFERGNPFLLRSSVGDMQHGTSSRRYHYWQAYQVYQIRKYYPLFASEPILLERLTDSATNDWERWKFKQLWPDSTDSTLLFANTDSLFEPLSIYIWLRKQEAKRSYAKADTGYGYQSIRGADLADYEQRLIDHARIVQQKYSLSEQQLIEFVVVLINFRNDLLKEEHLKLATEVEHDLWFLREFLLKMTGKAVDELAYAIDQHGGSWAKKSFRNLDKVAEATEEAASVLEHSMAEYNKQFTSQQITDVEIRKLLDFLNENDLFIVPYTIFESEEGAVKWHAFYETLLYIWMKNLSTGLEDFLRKIDERRLHLTSPSTKLLDPLIGDLFASWKGLFNKKRDAITKATVQHFLDPSDQAIWNIFDAYTRSDLDAAPHLRIFLISYWARNLTTHRHPFTNSLSHDLLYGYLGAHVFQALFHCFFYSWTYAKQQGWIK